jgi:DNA-binding MarR family transcriptional regulator
MNLDSGYLGQFIGQCFDREVFAALGRAGFGGVRASHGYVVQRLLEGPQTAGAIARAVGITQQAASKQLAEMADLGLVEAAPRGDDLRERRMQLSKRGRECVQRTRRARAAVTARLERALGQRAVRELEATLTRALDALGGLAAVQRRRVRVPAS